MIRAEIKRNTVKIFKTEYIPLKHDPDGKIVKGTGQSSEKLVDSFKRERLLIPGRIKNLLTKSEYKALENELKEAHEHDIKDVVNKEFAVTVEMLSGYQQYLHLIDFDRESVAKMDQIFGTIKRKARLFLKENIVDPQSQNPNGNI